MRILSLDYKINAETDLTASQKMIAPRDRLKTLNQIRNLKMARSAHAYVRGSTNKFYEWLESSSRCELPEGPPV